MYIFSIKFEEVVILLTLCQPLLFRNWKSNVVRKKYLGRGYNRGMLMR